jgi:hypothetical protein
VQAPAARNSGSIPLGLTPSLGAALNDGDSLLADGCALSLAGTRPPACVYGDAEGKLTVALVGDSHAAHWFPAIERLATQRGWRLVPLTKFSCVFVDLRIFSPNLKREYTECETWRENVVDRLIQLRPDLVIISSNRYLPVVDERDSDPLRQGAALARLIARIPGRREKEAARLSGAKLVDMSAATCPVDPCPPIIGTRLVYRDNHHLTATFARSLAGALGAALPAFGPQ